MNDLLLNKFTTHKVKKINLCRLFLKVESLAEICNATDTCILDAVC
jgi:hypothetical protein